MGERDGRTNTCIVLISAVHGRVKTVFHREYVRNLAVRRRLFPRFVGFSRMNSGTNRLRDVAFSWLLRLPDCEDLTRIVCFCLAAHPREVKSTAVLTPKVRHLASQPSFALAQILAFRRFSPTLRMAAHLLLETANARKRIHRGKRSSNKPTEEK